MSIEIRYVNLANPAAFAVQWGEPGGSQHQLVNLRGTTSLLFGTKTSDSDGWLTTTVVEPSRFGLTSAPTNYAEFMKIVRAFVER